MTSFEKGSTHFVYRVAAILLDGERVLLRRAEGSDFWSLPGGRVEIMEDAADALRREMREELGEEIEVGPLQFLIEAFFSKEDRSAHMLGLCFRASLPEGSTMLRGDGPFSGQEEIFGNKPMRPTFQWFPRDLAHLQAITLRPEGLATALANMTDTIQNLILSSS